MIWSTSAGARSTSWRSGALPLQPWVATRGEVGGDPERRLTEAEEAGALLGFHRLHVLDFPDRRLEGEIPRLAAALRGIVAEVRPDLLLTFDPEHPFPIYHHADHVAAARAVLELWEGPTLLFHTRRPNLAVDITEDLPVKVAAFAAHRSQLPARGAAKVVGWHLYRRHSTGGRQYVEVFRSVHFFKGGPSDM